MSLLDSLCLEALKFFSKGLHENISSKDNENEAGSSFVFFWGGGVPRK